MSLTDSIFDDTPLTSTEPASSQPEGIGLQGIIDGEIFATWENAWSQNITPWEVPEALPPLHEAIESSGLNFPRNGRALVPGCGARWDVRYISEALGHETLGLEISGTAVKAANELNEKAKVENPNLKISVEEKDFFLFDPPEEEKFDLIYDQKFFCAIHPRFRNDWGSQINKLLKPGGYLITLVYPIIPYQESGPPYYLRPEHYVEPLGPNFVKVLDKIPEKSHPQHEGKERLLVWKKRD